MNFHYLKEHLKAQLKKKSVNNPALEQDANTNWRKKNRATRKWNVEISFKTLLLL